MSLHNVRLFCSFFTEFIPKWKNAAFLFTGMLKWIYIHITYVLGLKSAAFGGFFAHIAWRTGVFSRHSRKTIEVTWIAEERGPSAVHGGRTVSNIIRPVFYWIMIRVRAFRQAKAAETHKLCVLQSLSSVNYYKPAEETFVDNEKIGSTTKYISNIS